MGVADESGTADDGEDDDDVVSEPVVLVPLAQLVAAAISKPKQHS